MTYVPTRIRVDVDARIAAIAARQQNAFSRAQSLKVGVTATTLKRRVRSERWGHPFPGVYTIAGSSPSWLQEVWCGLLAVGPKAIVTHESALRLHKSKLVPERPITLTVPHGRHVRLNGLVVHQIDDLRPGRVMTLSGLPVSTLERAIVEVAATLGVRRLADVLDEAVTANRTSYVRVAGCLREVARPGKPGVTKLATVLDERGDGYVPPQSELESAMFAVLLAGGLPAPRRQFRLPGRGAIDGLVDAAYPDARVIIEADGRRWHTRIRDLKRDHQRDTEAARAGWLTLRFMYEQIVREPEEVAAAIAEVLAGRGLSPRQ